MRLRRISKWIRSRVRYWSSLILYRLVSQRRFHLVGREKGKRYDIDVTYLQHPGQNTELDSTLIGLLSEVSHSYSKLIQESAPGSTTLRKLARHVPEIADFSNHHFLLWTLANLKKPRMVLEFGTASGTSLASLLCEQSVRHVLTVDILSLNENSSWVSSESRQALMDHLDVNSSRWSQVVTDASSLKSLREITERPDEIDLVFVDIGHDGATESHLGQIFEIDLNPGTLVVWDDIALGPMVKFWDQLAWRKIHLGSMGHYSGTGLSLVPGKRP